jgi:hypothetical protein
MAQCAKGSCCSFLRRNFRVLHYPLQRLGGASVAEIGDYGGDEHSLVSALIPIEPCEDEVQNSVGCSTITSWAHALHIRRISLWFEFHLGCEAIPLRCGGVQNPQMALEFIRVGVPHAS